MFQSNRKDETKGHNGGVVHDSCDASNHFQNKTTRVQKKGSLIEGKKENRIPRRRRVELDSRRHGSMNALDNGQLIRDGTWS